MQLEAGADKTAEMPKQMMEGCGGTTRTNYNAHQTSSADVEVLDSHTSDLMSRIISRSNMQLAYRRVVQNKGAPGVDAVSTGELKAYCQQHWPKVRDALLALGVSAWTF